MTVQISHLFISLPLIRTYRSKINEFKDRLEHYDQTRNFPAIKGVSYLSVHNRFGTVSIREIANICLQNYSTSGPKSWLNELIWRDFYFQIIVNFSHVQDGHSFKQQYDNLQYENNESFFESWMQGMTGFPIVDAAMRQLNTNRLYAQSIKNDRCFFFNQGPFD